MTTDLCKRYIAWRQKAGVADSTINRTLAALKRHVPLGNRMHTAKSPVRALDSKRTTCGRVLWRPKHG